MKKTVKQQPRMGIVRIPRSSSYTPAQDRWIAEQMRIDGVTQAFVLANCVSYASGLPMNQTERKLRHRRLPKMLYFRRRA